MAPKGWITAPLKDVVSDFIVPMRDKPSAFKGSIPWCRIEDFGSKYLSDSKSGQYVDAGLVKEGNLKIYPVGTVLVACSASLGTAAITQKPLVTNQTFIGLVPSEKIDKEFLYYLMLFNTDNLKRLASGTTIVYLSRVEFEQFKVQIPGDVCVQKNIAMILTSWDDAISQLERLIASKTRLKNGLMQKLLTGRVRFKGFGEVSLNGKLPADWRKLPLRSCADVRFSNVDKKTDKADRAVKLCNYMDVYANENITDEISFMNASATAREIERFALHRGDVVITKDSEAPDDIGIPTYIAQEIPDLVCGYHLALCRPKKNVASGRWLAKWFQLPQVKKYFISTANGVTRFGLATKDLYELPLWCPSVAEQERIADVIELADREILLLKKRLSELRQQKSGLMQKLLTGEIPVKV